MYLVFGLDVYQTNTEQSGFLQLLEPGDTVLADRGFDISDDIGVHGGKLTIPAFHEVNHNLLRRRLSFLSDWQYLVPVLLLPSLQLVLGVLFFLLLDWPLNN